MQHPLSNTHLDFIIPSYAGTTQIFERKKVFPINIIAYGAGANSTAMLVGLHQRGIPVDLILFADTGGEQPSTFLCTPACILQMQMEVDGVNRILFRAQEKYRLAEESGADKTELEGISEVITTAQELLVEISGEKELHASAEQQAQAALARAEALSQHQQGIDKKEPTFETPEHREREENSKLLLTLFDEFTTEGQREVLNRVRELSFIPGFRK